MARENLLMDFVSRCREPLDEWMHDQQWGTYRVSADRDQFSDDFVVTLRIVPVKYEGKP